MRALEINGAEAEPEHTLKVNDYGVLWVFIRDYAPVYAPRTV